MLVFPSFQELLQLEDRLGNVTRGAVQNTIERFTFPHKYKKVRLCRLAAQSGLGRELSACLLEPAWLSAGDTDQNPEAFALVTWLFRIFSLAHSSCGQEGGWDALDRKGRQAECAGVD